MATIARRRTNHGVASCAKGRRAVSFGVALISFSSLYHCEAFSPALSAQRTCRPYPPRATNPVFGDDAPSSSGAGTPPRKKHARPSAATRRLRRQVPSTARKIPTAAGGSVAAEGGPSSDGPPPGSGNAPKKPRRRRRTRPAKGSTASSAAAAVPPGVGADGAAGGPTRRAAKGSTAAAALAGSGGARHQRSEMLDHDVLTRGRELELGGRVVAANELRSSVAILIEDRRAALEERTSSGSGRRRPEDRPEIDGRRAADADRDEDGRRDDPPPPFEADGLDLWNVCGCGGVDATEDGEAAEPPPPSRPEDGSAAPRGPPSFVAGSDEWRRHRTEHRRQFKASSDGGRVSDMDRDDRILTDDDIRVGLNVTGGRTELRRILLEGLLARDELMRSNVRLVVSIAKRWMKRSARSSSDNNLVNLYAGGWDKPSLDEVVQEGVVGLSRAVDKYEPKRGLRFGTYATHWITSYVRRCFQTSATGCLRVPAQLHEIKGRYLAIIQEYGEARDAVPSLETVAARMGVSEKRLRTAIRVTQSLRSIDTPVFAGSGALKGSGAGGDVAGLNGLLISDTLQSTDAKPEELVELSLLRQCLENAMATELSPHERDVLRLRLGLDDGTARTAKEVAEACGGSLSAADVRSAERRAFKKLRSPNAVHTHNLLAYLDFADVDYCDVVARR